MAAGINHSDQPPGGGGGDELLARLLKGAGNCPADVVALAEAVEAATQTPVNGDLVTGAGLADRVTVLARIAMVIDAEVARSLAVADKSDVLPHAPVTHLQRHAGWSAPAAFAVVAAARDALEAEAAAVVLDLRGNPGGLLDEAIRVTSAFLEDGVVYRSVDRDGKQERIRTRGDAIIPDLPMVVLVDYGSASSAEIVAAALGESGRATVLGEPTYGTGTVLNVFPLSDGSAIRLGVQKWLTPDGASVFATGLEPEITVELPVDGIALEPADLRDLTRREFAGSGDAQLRRAVRLLAPARA